MEYLTKDCVINGAACAAVRHSSGKVAPVQEEADGEMASIVAAVRVVRRNGEAFVRVKMERKGRAFISCNFILMAVQ